MNLISVIVIDHDVVDVIAGTWIADEQGIEVAEKVFTEHCQSLGCDSDEEFDIDSAIENGYYAIGNASVCLTHHELNSAN
ncbi:MAG TPA: hypothetical protein PLP33_24670 [Leptospiraceae bacterium]|nr:hypothetical protein [Leptospiraceae bacterium]